MLRAAVAFAAFAAAGVSATSSGRFIFDCNARSTFLGCDQGDYANYPGDRFPQEFGGNTPPSRNGYCNSRAGGANGGSQEMHWTFKAERSDNYRVVVTKVGQPESSPVTTYQPGELLDVHVRVVQGNRFATAGFDFHEAPYSQRPTTADYWATAFRGIMLHWEKSTDNNAAGTFVDPTNTSGLDQNVGAADGGSWEVSEAIPPLFHLPQGSCGDSNEVLMHATGGYKQTYNKFQYRAPNAGTGSIALRVLIKSGDANWGWFWWPNAAGDVVLSEGTPYQPRANTRWLRADLGQSCDDRCRAYSNYVCNAAQLADIDDEAKLRDIVSDGIMTCVEPVFSGCSDLGPTTSTNGDCYFASPRCAAQGRTAAAPTCAATSTDNRNGRRLCPCGPAGTTGEVPTARTTTGIPGGVTTNTPTCPNPGEVFRAGACICDPATHELSSDGRCTPLEGSGAATATPLAAVAAAALAVAGGVSRTTILVAFALAMVALSSATGEAEAHNWLRSKSRAAFASTTSPYPPRTSDAPHVMVTWDQKFQVEWVLGHTRETYWVITHSSHIEKLRTIRDNDLDQYIDERPASQANLHLETSWRRWHRRRGRFGPGGNPVRPDTTNDWRNSDGTYDYRDFFANNNLDTAPPLAGQAADDRLPRSDAFSGVSGVPSSRGGYDGGNVYRLEFKDADLSLDGRAKYRNAAWPWILEVIRCEHNVNQGGRTDVVNIAITRDTADATRTPGTGHYLANWRWRGYYDMIDIDLVDTPVPVGDVYGHPYTGGTPYRRIDHAALANGRDVLPARGYEGTKCTEYLGNLDAVVRRCNGVSNTVDSCDGINVWPLYVPSTVNPNLVAPVEASSGRSGVGFNPLIPWGVNDTMGCNPAHFQGAPQGTLVAVPTMARQIVDDRQGQLTTTTDPEDLVFHTTVFAKDTGRNFTLRAGSPFGVSEPDLSWRFGHKCVSDCADLTKYTGFTVPPLAPKTVGCRNCEAEPVTVAPADVVTDAPKAKEYFLNSACGSRTDTTIYKDLFPRGYPGAGSMDITSVADCAVLTAADSDCSDIFVRQEGNRGGQTHGGRRCQCVRTGAAPCSRSNDGSYTVWQLDASPEASTADPTCARGTLSTSRDRCCPASCSQTDCDNGSGVCYTSGTNLLECTERGAPCMFTTPLPAAPVPPPSASTN